MFKTVLINLFSVALAVASTSLASGAPADLVNPWIGTGRAGNCYPGAQAPFGMISWSPSNTFDDFENGYSRPGYKYDRQEIYGFALTHISGVGCHAAQDMPIMPVVGDLAVSPVKNRNAYKSHFSHSHEEAHPGYYRVHLDDSGTDVELSVSERAGFGRFVFGKAGERSILFRPTETINNLAGASIKIDAGRHLLTGSMRSGGFCSRNPLDNPYTLYFYVEFNQPMKTEGFWRGADKQAGVGELAGDDIAAYLTFDSSAKSVEMRIGLSYVSEANAQANLATEIPNWDFAALRQRTTARWNELLGRVELEGKHSDQVTLYTALYHNLLQPSLFDDDTGEYLGFDDKVRKLNSSHHQYANYSNWDTYRTTAQLQGLLYPEIASEIATSLLRDADEGAPRGLPNWGYFNHDAGIMNGYSGIPFVVNAWAFGARGIDNAELHRALLQAADTQYDHGADYIKYGFVPSLKSPWNFCVSMTLEYSIADFCVARVCEAVGDKENASRFLKRAQNVFNLVDPETHYLRPRSEEGAWSKPFIPTQEAGFNEGNSTQYTWSVPQNIDRLVRSLGGAEVVEKRLDSFLSKILVEGWNTQEPYFWPSNEPCFGVPYIYCWIGRPWKTQEATQRIRALFTADPDGIPGDDDVGATSAYYLFNAIGLYPSIPGVGGFVITSPAFSRVTLHLAQGKTIVLASPLAADSNGYIESVSLNGRAWNSSWISLEDLTKKRKNEFRFVMSTQPNKAWASASESVPPSFDITAR